MPFISVTRITVFLDAIRQRHSWANLSRDVIFILEFGDLFKAFVCKLMVTIIQFRFWFRFHLNCFSIYSSIPNIFIVLNSIFGKFISIKLNRTWIINDFKLKSNSNNKLWIKKQYSKTIQANYEYENRK